MRCSFRCSGLFDRPVAFGVLSRPELLLQLHFPLQLHQLQPVPFALQLQCTLSLSRVWHPASHSLDDQLQALVGEGQCVVGLGQMLHFHPAHVLVAREFGVGLFAGEQLLLQMMEFLDFRGFEGALEDLVVLVPKQLLQTPVALYHRCDLVLQQFSLHFAFPFSLLPSISLFFQSQDFVAHESVLLGCFFELAFDFFAIFFQFLNSLHGVSGLLLRTGFLFPVCFHLFPVLLLHDAFCRVEGFDCVFQLCDFAALLLQLVFELGLPLLMSFKSLQLDTLLLLGFQFPSSFDQIRIQSGVSHFQQFELSLVLLLLVLEAEVQLLDDSPFLSRLLLVLLMQRVLLVSLQSSSVLLLPQLVVQALSLALQLLIFGGFAGQSLLLASQFLLQNFDFSLQGFVGPFPGALLLGEFPNGRFTFQPLLVGSRFSFFQDEAMLLFPQFHFLGFLACLAHQLPLFLLALLVLLQQSRVLFFQGLLLDRRPPLRRLQLGLQIPHLSIQRSYLLLQVRHHLPVLVRQDLALLFQQLVLRLPLVLQGKCVLQFPVFPLQHFLPLLELPVLLPLRTQVALQSVELALIVRGRFRPESSDLCPFLGMLAIAHRSRRFGSSADARIP